MTVGKLRYFQSEGQDIDWDQYGRGPFRINAQRLDGYLWHEILPFEHYRDYYEVFSKITTISKTYCTLSMH